jgi:hypothetical protein
MARYDTVSNIIADVGSELGLGTLTAVLPVIASTDAVVAQLQALLKAAGRGLVLENPWLQQRTDYTFNTTTATVYTLPAAFQRMVDGSGWNRTKRMPLVPLSPQAWEGMKAIAVTSALPVFFPHGGGGARHRPQHAGAAGDARQWGGHLPRVLEPSLGAPLGRNAHLPGRAHRGDGHPAH